MAQALLIFKPDAAYRLRVRSALWSWVAAQRDWKLASLQWFQPPAELIERHYDFLRERPFFPWLVDFMTALPLLVGRLEAEPPALEAMRYELGETRIQQSRPGSLRERYGIYAGVNCLHLSDAADTGDRELRLWAPYLKLDGGPPALEESPQAPDHTFHLRSLAAQVASGIHQDAAALEIRRLLREETDLAGRQFEALCRVILGALP